MRRAPLIPALALLLAALPVHAADAPPAERPTAAKPEPRNEGFKPEQVTTHGSVTVGGRRIDYEAVAGTLVVHPKDWDDVPQNADKEPAPEASMFYVAYFASDPKGGPRPVTFIYNGGPGSATVWLHMGAFGPRRVVTSGDAHTPAAPYAIVNNDSSLLDASDLVFIDAPGTGFSRVAGKDRDKAFFGVDQDGQAFADFVAQFLAKYGRWNSPKYLFGESYGTTRSAVLANLLETDRSIDLNGVILLSQILAFDGSVDRAESNPGVDLPYELALPTYAATAWYHHRLPDAPATLAPLLAEVEHFAMTDYALALAAGASLPPEQRRATIARLHRYTGLPEDYIDKANLRVSGGEFRKTLQADGGATTGRLDTRFSGPTLDPLSKSAEYDPQSAALRSAYVSAFNEYARKDLRYGDGRAFKASLPLFRTWQGAHQPPGSSFPAGHATNVMPDLANAMKQDPNLHVMLHAGYYDLATPYFQGVYEMRHLPIPAELQKNIEYQFYESGHMVYAHEPSLKLLHDSVAAFIRRTDHLPGR
ncbi:MAG: peptidase S10 [Proteobacteria bacterium]|nr:peptidase S10 [Pseudomonadota bacterium]